MGISDCRSCAADSARASVLLCHAKLLRASPVAAPSPTSSRVEREKANHARRYDFYLDDTRRTNAADEKSGKGSERVEHRRGTNDRATTLLFADALPRGRRRIQRQADQSGGIKENR